MKLQTSVMSYGTLPNSATVPLYAESEGNGKQGEPPTTPCACSHEESPSVRSTASEAAEHIAARTTFAPRQANPTPDFSQLTTQEKLAYTKAERERIFG